MTNVTKLILGEKNHQCCYPQNHSLVFQHQSAYSEMYNIGNHMQQAWSAKPPQNGPRGSARKSLNFILCYSVGFFRAMLRQGWYIVKQRDLCISRDQLRQKLIPKCFKPCFGSDFVQYNMYVPPKTGLPAILTQVGHRFMQLGICCTLSRGLVDDLISGSTGKEAIPAMFYKPIS